MRYQDDDLIRNPHRVTGDADSRSRVGGRSILPFVLLLAGVVAGLYSVRPRAGVVPPLLSVQERLPGTHSDPQAPLSILCTWLPTDRIRPVTRQFPQTPLLVTRPGSDVRLVLLQGVAALPLEVEVEPPLTASRIEGGKTAMLTMPEKAGAYWLTIRGGGREERVCVFVPYEAEGQGAFGRLRVNGTDLGTYSDPRRSGTEKVSENPEAYTPPTHFIELTERTETMHLVPGREAGEFVIRDRETGERHTRYLPVNTDLLDAVEALDQVVALYFPESARMRIISGFRTPLHNRRIGSGAFSRHVYGDAIDIVIDMTGDGRMDDLTGDGSAGREEGLLLVAILERLMANGRIPVGGIGVYTFARGVSQNGHAVTVHVDLRGHRARWGIHYTGRGRQAFDWQSRDFAEHDRAEAAERAAAGRPALPAGVPLPNLPTPRTAATP